MNVPGLSALRRTSWNSALYAYVFVVIAFLILPVLIIFPMSVTPGRFMIWPPAGMSMRWYENLFTDPRWTAAAFESFRVGIVATVISVTLGTLAAFGIVRSQFRGKPLIFGFLLSPWIMPQIIIATSLYFLVSNAGLIGNWIVLAAGHAVLALPVVVVIVSGTVVGLNVNLEHAAFSLGASRFQTFRRIVLPLIAPGVFSAAVFAFLISLDELLLAIFLGGERAVTLPRRIWSGLRFSVDPTIAALGVLLVLGAFILAVAVGLRRVDVSWRKER